MKNLTARLLVAVALVALAGCPTTHHSDAQKMATEAETGVFMTGTLAVLGSFEWDAAPLYNHNASARHDAAVALKQGRITQEEAQRRLDVTDKARELLDAAVAACAQSGRTGKCTKDEANGRVLLDEARKVLADVP